MSANPKPKLDDLLNSLTLPSGQVRPFFYYDLSAETEADVLHVCFQCLPCEEMLVWKTELWVCPECEFPLTTKLAVSLLDDAVDAIDHVRSVVAPSTARSEPAQEKKKWGWLRFFKRRASRLT